MVLRLVAITGMPMPINALRAQLPAYAKDIAANLGVLAEETLLSDQAKWGCFIASASAVGEPETLKAVTIAAREGCSSELPVTKPQKNDTNVPRVR